MIYSRRNFLKAAGSGVALTVIGGETILLVAAAPPALAKQLYEHFLAQIEAAASVRPERGQFGADMKVALVNDGPVTLILDSRSPD